MNELARYAVRGEVAIEDFQDGSLAMLCDQLVLIALNPTAREALGNLDGGRTVHQVADALMRRYGQLYERVLEDVLELLADLEAKGLVERLNETKETG